MSIGETLARARRDAGLSIAEVSRRTGIRLSVIDGIEHDDYSACGGANRTRDTLAAIAQALGVDSGPLIEAYDDSRRPADSGWIAASTPAEPILAGPEPEALTPAQEAEPRLAAEDTQPISMDQPPEPVPTAEAPRPLTTGESFFPIPPDPITPDPITPDPITPGEARSTHRAPEPAWLAFADRVPVLWIALGGALLVFVALGGILLIVGASGQVTRPDVNAGRHVGNGRGGTHPARTRPSPGHARPPGQTRPASPERRRPVRALVPASIAAFGPGGTGQGDSPQLAHRALAGKADAPWHSAWYTTARFGNLQPGTGLLLDMGRPVTITSARIALGNRSGTDLALRVGNSPALGSLPPVAHANDAGGLVRLKTARARGRYVLVWFTRLPEDQAGTFQVAVYDVKLRGYR